jgi:hypothetical protein
VAVITISWTAASGNAGCLLYLGRGGRGEKGKSKLYIMTSSKEEPNGVNSVRNCSHFVENCHVLGVCVTYKMGFGFDDRIYWIFIKPVATFHKSLSILDF